MSDSVHVFPGTPKIEEALLAQDETTRIIARASSSVWMQHFNNWLQDEFQRSDHTKLLYALAQIQIMTHASLAASMVKPQGYPASLLLYSEMLKQYYVDHAEKSAAANRALREAGR